jgi:hypothetical protein
MRRLTTFAVAVAIAAGSVAAPALAARRHHAAPAQSGYYVIRWENTGICQIWNTDLTSKPVQWPSTYKVVSQPVPTFNEASAIQIKLRDERRCTL